MDLGEPFKHEMRIEPGEEGTFIVYVNERPHREGVCFGFTTIDDLLIWMAKNGGAKARVTELSEGDVVKPYPQGLDRLMEGVMQGLDGSKLVRTPEGGIRRTTAAEIIAARQEHAKAVEQAAAQAEGYERAARKTLGERLDAMGETGQAIRRELVAQTEMRPVSNDAA
jgi:hypothetical protein